MKIVFIAKKIANLKKVVLSFLSNVFLFLLAFQNRIDREYGINYIFHFLCELEFSTWKRNED